MFMESDKIFEESTRYLMDTYGRLPVAPRKGRGVRIWSADDREYLDFVGGIAVNVLGHCHPKVVVAIQKQAQRLIHVSNLYYIENQVKLARLLVEHSFADNAFFCNSGAEANEGAIKLARKYSRTVHGEGKYEIVAALNSFHGRTYGALSATGQTKFHAGFEPMLPGFVYVPFGDAEALKKAVAADRTCAVLLEPIQAEGGVRVPPPDYFRQVREICDTSGALLILDEVQTGMGRTGELFAYKHFGIKPDIMTLAKGLGGGVPIGAVLGTDRVAQAFTPGSHAATFGGNPLAIAAANVVTDLLNEKTLASIQDSGKILMDGLHGLHMNEIKEIRGKGLIIGVEMQNGFSSKDIASAMLKRGVLIGTSGDSVIRLLPPFIITEKEISKFLLTFRNVVSDMSVQKN